MHRKKDKIFANFGKLTDKKQICCENMFLCSLKRLFLWFFLYTFVKFKFSKLFKRNPLILRNNSVFLLKNWKSRNGKIDLSGFHLTGSLFTENCATFSQNPSDFSRFPDFSGKFEDFRTKPKFSDFSNIFPFLERNCSLFYEIQLLSLHFCKI